MICLILPQHRGGGGGTLFDIKAGRESPDADKQNERSGTWKRQQRTTNRKQGRKAIKDARKEAKRRQREAALRDSDKAKAENKEVSVG